MTEEQGAKGLFDGSLAKYMGGGVTLGASTLDSRLGDVETGTDHQAAQSDRPRAAKDGIWKTTTVQQVSLEGIMPPQTALHACSQKTCCGISIRSDAE